MKQEREITGAKLRTSLNENFAQLNARHSLYTTYGKRFFDLMIAGTLSVFLIPVLILIAASIRLSSSKSVLFKQTRHGLGGKTFQIYKFRTMTVSEDGAAFRQAVYNDQRVTGIGLFLRRTSLDELPQLINVLNGTMSIIGPRPHPTALDEVYAPLISGYARRFAVKPGITGLAQVRGHRGPTDTLDAMAKRIHCDVEYVEQISLFLEIKILLSTIRVVLHGTNAV